MTLNDERTADPRYLCGSWPSCYFITDKPQRQKSIFGPQTRNVTGSLP